MAWRIPIVTGLVICLLATVAPAQFTRESGVGSIAGTLQKAVDEQDDFEFSSRGNQVLFADLDADVFLNETEDAGGETGCSDSSEGCATPDEGEEGSGCEDGGPGRFALEVLDVDQTVLCSATRPTRPGWERDPRLACLLTDAGYYILRVKLSGMGGNHAAEDLAGKVFPYLLNVSLRERAPDLPGTDLDQAIKKSVNRLPFKE